MHVVAAKRERLKEIVRSLERVVVAYSGGVDSAFLLKVCLDVLGPERVLAVTGQSPAVPEHELAKAAETARTMGAEHLILPTFEMDDPGYVSNPANRCYYCKSELFSRLAAVAAERGYRHVVAGANADDLGDYRPGLVAGREWDVRQPLAEAGLTKAEVRAWSRELGLPTWNKPAQPCLASRLPYGTPITVRALSQVDRAELFLRGLGLRDVRVRHHDTVARIEVEPAAMELLLRHRDRVVARLRELGYQYVTLDLQGFRSGSLNEGLSLGPRNAQKPA